MKASPKLPPALLAEIRKVCPDMKPPYTPGKFLARVRRVAGPLVDVRHDRLTGSYRATCVNGYRFDVDLHELVAVYWTPSMRVTLADRIEALVELLYAFVGPGGDRAELCDDPSCDWCGRSEEVSQ